MNKQCKVELVRWPLEETGFEYKVVRTNNLAEPVVGKFLDLTRVTELCADPTVEVQIEICGLGK